MKYECQKTGGNLKFVNHNIAQPNTMSFELLRDKFIVQFAGENVFIICEHLEKLQATKMVDCVIHPIRLRRLSSKMQNSPDK